jgi:hypothetical protein
MTKRPLPSPAMVVACLALFAAMGGTGYAATQLGGNEGQATASKKGKVKRGPRGKRGRVGAQGAVGPAGPPGASATTLWAQVNGTGGVLGRNSNAVSASDLGSVGNGSYEVIFNRDISNCVYMGTIGGPDNQTSPGEISVARRFQQPNGVFVSTSSSAGAGADRSFYVAVFC